MFLLQIVSMFICLYIVDLCTAVRELVEGGMSDSWPHCLSPQRRKVQHHILLYASSLCGIYSYIAAMGNSNK